MTEEEAAEKLAALLRDIEVAGHRVGIVPNFGSGHFLVVGDNQCLYEPTEDDGVWEVAP